MGGKNECKKLKEDCANGFCVTSKSRRAYNKTTITVTDKILSLCCISSWKHGWFHNAATPARIALLYSSVCTCDLITSGDTFKETIHLNWTGVASVLGQKPALVSTPRGAEAAGVNRGTKRPPVFAKRRGNSRSADWCTCGNYFCAYGCMTALLKSHDFNRGIWLMIILGNGSKVSARWQ